MPGSLHRTSCKHSQDCKVVLKQQGQGLILNIRENETVQALPCKRTDFDEKPYPSIFVYSKCSSSSTKNPAEFFTARLVEYRFERFAPLLPLHRWLMKLFG